MPARHARSASSPSTQLERAYRSIKAGIVRGRYPPGSPLSEVALAAEHGMSRTPIREGLSRLWTERYLERVAGHGYFVARVTVQTIHDTFDVRRLLEGAAAARAATHATCQDISGLRRLATFPTDGDYRQAEAANARFHLAIAVAARNQLASELIERCLAQVDRFMSLGVSFGRFQAEATTDHVAIVQAIEAHEPDRARARMEEHLDRGSRSMKEALLESGIGGIGVE